VIACTCSILQWCDQEPQNDSVLTTPSVHALGVLQWCNQEPEPQEDVALDNWLLDFAAVFRETSGIDPERHFELQQLGWEKVQEAMEATITCDKALPLLDAAALKFAEVTASGATRQTSSSLAGS
jgi:hypothetical protein